MTGKQGLIGRMIQAVISRLALFCVVVALVWVAFVWL